MDYREAVKLARDNREEGFQFLYEQTYKSKYYLAIQYMKNEEAAQDVLQDAYMKAFSRLDTLEEPEAFPGWLGTIVGNTAKNALQKKNPTLFSELEERSGGDFVYEREDEDGDRQPEISYTRKETQKLVREMIDALSEEQRLCILMYEIEGLSIRKIAESLNCSENTVKSRLNYGRKNLKAKAEELQKKGWKLYSVAPIPLLLFLLRTDEEYWAADGRFVWEEEQIAKRVLPDSEGRIRTRERREPGYGRGEKEKAENRVRSRPSQMEKKVSAGAGKGFLHTAVGKLTLTAAVLGVICGGVYYEVFQASERLEERKALAEEAQAAAEVFEAEQERDDSQEGEIPEKDEAQEQKELPEETYIFEEEEADAPQEMKDEDYAARIAGELTKEEVEFVLAYGPEEIPAQGFQERDLTNFINAFCQARPSGENPVEFYGNDGRGHYSARDVNRLLSAFTAYQLTEENDSDTEYGLNIEGEELVYVPATLGYSAEAVISRGEYTEEEMELYYSFSYVSGDPAGGRQEQSDKKAVLRPGADGKYRIISIEKVDGETEKATEDPEQNETQTEKTEGTADGQEIKGEEENVRTVRDIYEGVLRAVQNQEAGYEFSGGGLTGTMQYFLYDMDGDGLPELITGAECEIDVFYGMVVRVYGCREGDGGYALRMIEGNELTLGLYLAQDGNGLFSQDTARMAGDQSLYRLTIQNDVLVKGGEPEYEFKIGDSGMQTFIGANPAPQWTDISSTAGLDILG